MVELNPEPQNASTADLNLETLNLNPETLDSRQDRATETQNLKPSHVHS